MNVNERLLFIFLPFSFEDRAVFLFGACLLVGNICGIGVSTLST